jgi:hypothetical protein
MAASVLRDAHAARSAARVEALRKAGYQIIREIDGTPRRVIVDLDTLLAEADGVEALPDIRAAVREVLEELLERKKKPDAA